MTRLASILAGLALSLFAGPATAGTENRFFGVVQGARLDDRDLKTLSETGVGSVRFLLNWPSVEPSPGSYEWAATDELVGGLAAHGIQPLPFVYGSTSWVAARSIRPPTGS